MKATLWVEVAEGDAFVPILVWISWILVSDSISNDAESFVETVLRISLITGSIGGLYVHWLPTARGSTLSKDCLL